MVELEAGFQSETQHYITMGDKFTWWCAITAKPYLIDLSIHKAKDQSVPTTTHCG